MTATTKLGKQSLSATVYLTLVFVAGAAVGVVGDRLYSMRTVTASVAPRTPEEWKVKYLADLHERVHLTPDQMSKVNAILEDAHRRFDLVHERSQPELAQIHNDQVKRVREVLAEDQKKAYDQFRADRDKARRAAQK